MQVGHAGLGVEEGRGPACSALASHIPAGAVRTVIRAESPVAPRRRLSCPRRVATTCKLYTVVLVEIYRTQDGSRLNRL